MSLLKGRCHCGKSQFEIAAEPEFQFVCYCNDCKHINSGGHLCGMLFEESNLKAPNEISTYVYPGGSGKDIELHFCGHCATHLYALPKEYPGKVVVRANTLDEGHFKPQQELFKDSAFSWDK